MIKSQELDDHLPGFDAPEDNESQIKESRIGKKKKKGSGGFQCMGFSFPILKGITKRGYKQPTPIQRKTIPLALQGKDVVAMARTGSGKTACFVLPILENLLSPSHKPMPGKNFRALILSPTRELALQTLRFVRELGKFSGLRSAAILGGESIEQQFSTMSGAAPDIVVATPGRFLHVCMEMDLKLDNIKTVVFDEADRLFELGFGEQVRALLGRLPAARHSLLFSATLPAAIVHFARAQLHDPVLVRLDVEWKLPATLWLGWMGVRAELRPAALLVLLDGLLRDEQQQALVFAATRHHVEYLHLILSRAGISSACAYSGLEAAARKIALARFVHRQVSVLCVTDVAARGLDLPALHNVINYNFPAKPKLFVHRVGRSARAGRAGRAFTLVAAEDVAHLLDLQLFLDSKLLDPTPEMGSGQAAPSGVWGCIPAATLELRHQDVLAWERDHSDIAEAARVCARGWQQYSKWREPASADANRRAKLRPLPAAPHPFLSDRPTEPPNDLVTQINNYTPKGTILELSGRQESAMCRAMKLKKEKHGALVQRVRENKKLMADAGLEESVHSRALPPSEGDGDAGGRTRARERATLRHENYIPHFAADHHTERGMAVNFAADVDSAQLDLAQDCGEAQRAKRHMLHWDRKRKKMVHVDPDGGRKMIRTESGARVPASYRSGRYQEWAKRNGAGAGAGPGDGAGAGDGDRYKRPASEFRPQWVRHNERVARHSRDGKGQHLKDKQQIVKDRIRKEKIKAKLKHKNKNKNNKKKKKK